MYISRILLTLDNVAWMFCREVKRTVENEDGSGEPSAKKAKLASETVTVKKVAYTCPKNLPLNKKILDYSVPLKYE